MGRSYDIMRKGQKEVERTASTLVKLVISAVLRLYKSYWRLIMAEPKCNECGASGVEHIVSTESNEQSKGGDAWFNIVYCEKCGHICGVFANTYFIAWNYSSDAKITEFLIS